VLRDFFSKFNLEKKDLPNPVNNGLSFDEKIVIRTYRLTPTSTSTFDETNANSESTSTSTSDETNANSESTSTSNETKANSESTSTSNETKANSESTSTSNETNANSESTSTSTSDETKANPESTSTSTSTSALDRFLLRQTILESNSPIHGMSNAAERLLLAWCPL
jgi:hypothetical protein